MAAPTSTPSATAADPLGSPAISAYSFVTTVSQPLRSESDNSDDEIVWSISDGFASSSGSSANGSSEDGAGSDDDYVLLTHPASAAVSIAGISTPDAEAPGASVALAIENLEARMNALRLADSTSKKAAKRAKKGAKSANAVAKVGSGTTSVVKPKQKRKKTKKLATPIGHSTNVGAYLSPPSAKQKKEGQERALIKHTRGLGARPIVDDFSDGQSIVSYDNESSADSPTLYEEASAFISSFLSNPDAKNDSVYRLTLLQSIIIELGLATATLPKSLKAAKAFVKSRVFLNIREYLAVREQGPEAVQRAIYPSKSALIKDIKRNPTSLKWVKQHGLQVLLVGWMQH